MSPRQNRRTAFDLGGVGKPRPVVDDTELDASRRRIATSTSTVLPTDATASALSSRLSRICSIAPGTQRTSIGRPSDGRCRRSTPRSSATAVHVSTRSPTSAPRSATSVAGRSSARASCSRFDTNSVSRSVSSIARSTASTAGWSGSPSSAVGEIALQVLESQSQRGQRGTQLMRGIRHETPLSRSTPSRRCAIVAIVSSSTRISGGPSGSCAATERSPLANRDADAVSSRSGSRDRPSDHPADEGDRREHDHCDGTERNQNVRIRSLTSPCRA